MLGLVLTSGCAQRAGGAGGAESEGAPAGSGEGSAGGEDRGAEGADEVPGIADMPYLPLRLESTSVRFQRVYRLTTLASESPLAAPAADASEAEVQVWVRDVLAPWIALRTEIIEACALELRALRGGERDEHIVAAALMGYLYEDTALQLRGVRVPVGGRSARDVRAAPPERIEALLERARRSFERCLAAGLGALEVASYRQYCEEASLRLGPSSAEHFDGESASEAATEGEPEGEREPGAHRDEPAR